MTAVLRIVFELIFEFLSPKAANVDEPPQSAPPGPNSIFYQSAVLVADAQGEELLGNVDELANPLRRPRRF